MARRTLILCLLLAGAIGLTATAASTWRLDAPLPASVHLQDMTWVEVRATLEAGKTVVLVPTAGLEQNGPHLVLGKHHYVVRHAAERIAKTLGNALVAPVLDYVPEGGIEPAEGHMRFPGTISVPESVFAGILEATARSLRAHGFTLIAFLGDSGGNQAVQAAVAERLDAEWRGSGTRVLQVSDYYAANGQTEWLLARGETPESIGRHAGIRDSAELMAVRPAGVRPDRIAPGGGRYGEATGVDGDPTRASAEIGERMIRLKVEAAVRQIRAALEGPRAGS